VLDNPWHSLAPRKVNLGFASYGSLGQKGILLSFILAICFNLLLHLFGITNDGFWSLVSAVILPFTIVALGSALAQVGIELVSDERLVWVWLRELDIRNDWEYIPESYRKHPDWWDKHVKKYKGKEEGWRRWDYVTGSIATYWWLKGFSFLTHKKLVKLWNLHKQKGNVHSDSDDACLAIVTKLQDPFRYENSFATFRDDPRDLHERITDLENEKDMLLKRIHNLS
jgi:hypothetical protein